MKSGIVGVVTLVVVACSSASGCAQSGSPGTVISDPDALRHGWIFSLDEGRAKARQSAKPLMVVLRCNP